MPKPHTPFQWCKQEEIDSIKRKQRALKDLGRRYRLDVKVHHAETSLLEGVISRGDRTLCRVVERAWRAGCRFDGWTDHFNFEKWMEAFREEGVAIEPYLAEFPVKEFDKPRAPLVQLPWDHLDTLVLREFNAREYIKGIKAKISPPCELPVEIIDGRPTAIAPSHEDFERVASRPLLCYNCGMECDLTLSRKHLEKAVALHKEVRTYQERIAPLQELIEKPLVQLKSEVRTQDSGEPAPAGRKTQDPLSRYRATFEKGEAIKYLSHLDLTRALPRAFRRAKIALGYSQGFHPMPLIQYGPALGVGTVGENELIDFDSADQLEESDFLARINRVLPDGFRFKSLERLSVGAKALIKEFNRAEYSVPLDSPELVRAALRARTENGALESSEDIEIHNKLASEYMSRESVVIVRARKEKRQQIDVRRYTIRLTADQQRQALKIVTELSPNGGAKPTEILAAVYGMTFEEVIPLSSRVRRLRLFSENLADSDPQIGRQPVAAHAGGK